MKIPGAVVGSSLRCFWLFVVTTAILVGCGPKPPPNLDKMRGRAAIVEDEPWPSKMEKLAEQQVIDAWSKYQVALDFSVKSIQAEERMLDKMTQSAEFRALPPTEQKTAAFIAGAYLGEVIRRHHNGVWSVDSPDGGRFSFPVILDQTYEVFPCMWCVKRLGYGANENIWRKYQALVVNRTNDVAAVPGGTPGTNLPSP